MMWLYLIASYAQERDTSNVAKTVELDEVVVKASYLTR